jgi:hypothetical protein
VLRGTGILAAAIACAAVFGVGVPLAWVWVASKLQPTVGEGTGSLAALVVIAGPFVSYTALVLLAGRFSRPRDRAPGPQRMAWNRSRDEVRPNDQPTSALEQVVLVAIVLLAIGFEVWFFFFAHPHVWHAG